MGKKYSGEDQTLPFFNGEKKKGEEISEALAPENAYLNALNGEYKGQIYMLRLGEMVVGRQPECDIFLDDSQVSRQHAKLVTDHEKTVVLDLKSTNGTFVNEKKVNKAVLREGDKLRIGQTIFQFTAANPFEASTLGLKNHGYFEERLQNEIFRARRYNRSVSLTMIGLSFQKGFGTGRAEGEVEKLKLRRYYDFVRQLRKSGFVREIDLMGSYGKHELEIMMPETGKAAALQMAQKILQQTSEDPEIFVSIGVANYPEDSTSKDILLEKSRQAMKQARLKEKNSVSEIKEEVRHLKLAEEGDVVIRSEKMVQIFDLAAKIAKSNMSVLIQGETGVGKEVIAETIHAKSDRAKQPLIRVNCAALTETILESELFGHEKGSFTGADRLKIGLFESAKGGTIFLDEIGEMPLKTQAKLLRVLQSKKIMRVGGTQEIDIDVRVIAATNRNLEEWIQKGVFREDLYYRLNAITIVVPPLRERREEIELLALRFVQNSCAENNIPVKTISREAMEALKKYDWPGNVREVKNCIERAVVITEGEMIDPESLSENIFNRSPLSSKNQSLAEMHGSDTATVVGDAKALIQDFEKRIIKNALEQSGWNQTKAAELLKIPRRTLVSKIKKFKISK